MALRRLIQKQSAPSGYPQSVVAISSLSSSTSSSSSLSHPSSSSSSPPSYSSDSHSQPVTTTTPTKNILTVPHPRVRSLYKELLSVCQHHPTFPMSKCRQKIKEGFARNKSIAVYADGSGYTIGKGEAAHMSEEKGKGEHEDQHTRETRNVSNTESATPSKRGGLAAAASSSTGIKEGHEGASVRRSDCDEEMAVLKGLGLLHSSVSSSNSSSSSSSGNDAFNGSTVCGRSDSDSLYHHPQDTLEALADRRRDAGLHYSKDFMRALAWGRYAVRDIEALINFHKYRAMKARYEWKKDEDNQ